MTGQRCQGPCGLKLGPKDRPLTADGLCEVCDEDRRNRRWLRETIARIERINAEGLSSHPGESNPAAVLTRQAVRFVRAARRHGDMDQVELAMIYGVHRRTIGKIEQRITWNHVQSGGPWRLCRGEAAA